MHRILVVDDDQNVRLVYREMLNEAGYEVLESESGNETFEILNREPIDLVVLDIKLRSESGLDVLQKITRQFPELPVILCSAYASYQDDYTSWLAESYIIKSTDLEELSREVDRVLQKREAKLKGNIEAGSRKYA
ncbi:MAG: response regulator [Candidatus Dadabacteria bacterium]|nr:response regulator [Candidatus Dadabacteria bacterium]